MPRPLAEISERPDAINPMVNRLPSRTQLPLVVISGATGKTTTGWILVRLLEQAGLEVGAWLSGGVYVDGAIRHDELRAWELATNAARAREVDVLVQEIPSVLATTVPRGIVSTAVFTTICGSDGQCQRGKDSHRYRAAIAELAASVHPGGNVIANADDPLIVAAVEAQAARPVWFAMSNANPILQAQLQRGNDGFWVEDGCIKAQIAGIVREITSVEDLPASLCGHLLFQVQNTLAAFAAAVTIPGIPETWQPDPAHISPNDPRLPSGVREISVPVGSMLVDAPGTLNSVKQIARGVRSASPRRVVLAMDVFRTFSDDEILDAGRALGSIAGIAILVGNGGNQRRLDLLKVGMMRSDTPPAIILRPSMDAAVSHARSLLANGDLALILNPPSPSSSEVRRQTPHSR